MSTSNEIGDEHINGLVEVAVAGTITGIVRGPSWREVNVQLPEGVALIRFYDSDPITLGELAEGEPDVVVPEPVEGEPPV